VIGLNKLQMPKEKLIKDQISYTEERQLQPEEIQLLKDKVFRQIIIYLPGYLLLIGGALIIYMNAPNSFKMVVDHTANLDDEETGRMWRLAPYVSLFVLLMSTIFFGKIFYQSILPILKDIKHKTKTLIFYKPEKTAMTLFNRYYLSTPLSTKRQIQIDDKDFNTISDADEICVEVSKSSLLILGLKKNDKKINYY
jgi:hypothetical protein